MRDRLAAWIGSGSIMMRDQGRRLRRVSASRPVLREIA